MNKTNKEEAKEKSRKFNKNIFEPLDSVCGLVTQKSLDTWVDAPDANSVEKKEQPIKIQLRIKKC